MVFSRERLIAVAIALAVGCGGFVFGLRWLESLITFHPDRMTAAEMKAIPAGAESVWFNSADGTRLHGWFFESQSKAATATIVFFHGNGGHIGNVGIEFGKFCRGHRFAVVAALVAFPGEESI
jgi:hypothetical protein